jgi:hypothetical protein
VRESRDQVDPAEAPIQGIWRRPPGNLWFSANQVFADFPSLSTALLRRAAEIDPEVAILLSRHPRNVDGVISLVHLRE